MVSVEVTIKQAFEKHRKFKKDSQEAKTITDKITAFMALDNRPLSMAEDQGFH